MNGGPGNVAISFPSGLTYTPGVKQTWTINITDANARAFGFQATARLASNPTSAMAGTFSNVNNETMVSCDNDSPRSGVACPSAFAVEFIMQATAKSSGTFTVEWTPPATASGDVRVFVAGNAGNGNNTNSGDRIYTANYTLRSASQQTQGGGLFRPIIPCRLMDTRLGSGQTADFGAPGLRAGVARTLPVSEHACGVPAGTLAYAINITVVPVSRLGYLTVYPAGAPQPVASALNSDDGRVVANAAIVPAGAGGAITFFATDPADIVVDIAGYFTPF